MFDSSVFVSIEFVNWEPRRPWAAVLRQRTGRTSCITETLYQSADALDAANEAMDYAMQHRLPLRTADHLRDMFVCRWQQSGAEMYREGVERSYCANAYIKQGWDAAYHDDRQPLAVHGWPVAQFMEVEAVS